MDSQVSGTELIKALTKAQMDIQPPKKDKENPRFKSGYCSLDSIYAACRIPLAKNGLVLSHSVNSTEGKSYLCTTLYHVSGESMENKIPLFIDQQTSQGFASALTYARRYAVCSLLGLPSDEDDDGEQAMKVEQKHPSTLSKEQASSIISLIGDDAALMDRVLKAYKVNSFTRIAASEYESIVKRIKAIKEER